MSFFLSLNLDPGIELTIPDRLQQALNKRILSSHHFVWFFNQNIFSAFFIERNDITV